MACTPPQLSRKKYEKARALFEKGEPQGDQTVDSLKQDFEQVASDALAVYTECNLGYNINTIQSVCPLCLYRALPASAGWLF